MKGIFVAKRAEDQEVIGELRKGHEIAVRDSLWDVGAEIGEDASGYEGLDFMVTNMPYDEVAVKVAGRSNIPENDYLDMIYGHSFDCLDMIHELFPGMVIIIYTGADETTCVKALKEHHVGHVIRRGRYELKYEIAEIRKLLAGEEFTPLWNGNKLAKEAKKIAFIDEYVDDKNWKKDSRGKERYATNTAVVDALKKRHHDVKLYRHLWSAAKFIVDGDSEKYGPFDFVITHLPHNPPPHPKMPSVIASRDSEAAYREQMEMYMKKVGEYWEKKYGISMRKIGLLREHLPGTRVILYTGAPREICDICEKKHGVSHVVLRYRPLRGFPMCNNLKGPKIELEDILSTIRNNGS
jgi:hypothetical protein